MSFSTLRAIRIFLQICFVVLMTASPILHANESPDDAEPRLYQVSGFFVVDLDKGSIQKAVSAKTLEQVAAAIQSGGSDRVRIMSIDTHLVANSKIRISLGSSNPTVVGVSRGSRGFTQSLQKRDAGTIVEMLGVPVGSSLLLNIDFKASFAEKSKEAFSVDDSGNQVFADRAVKLEVENQLLFREKAPLVKATFSNRGRNVLFALKVTPDSQQRASRDSKNSAQATASAEPLPKSSLSKSRASRYRKYIDGLLDRYDSNRDGIFDESELAKMRRPPRAADLDRNGNVSAKELFEYLVATAPQDKSTDQ